MLEIVEADAFSRGRFNRSCANDCPPLAGVCHSFHFLLKGEHEDIGGITVLWSIAIDREECLYRVMLFATEASTSALRNGRDGSDETVLPITLL